MDRYGIIITQIKQGLRQSDLPQAEPGNYPIQQQKASIQGTAPKVSKGRRLAIGGREIAERIRRNERPFAATMEAADAARRRETSAFGKQS